VLLLILACVLMVWEQRYARLAQLREPLAMLVVPLEHAVNLPFRFAAWLGLTMTDHQALVEQNNQLKAQQLLLRAQVQKFLALEKENAQLRALLQSAARTSDKVLVAQLLAIDSNPFVQEMILDKGSQAGVFVGQPVLDASGVMGQVVAVEQLTSRVMLITDNRSAVPVQILRSGLRAIVIGNGDTGQLSLIHMTQTADVQPGDILVSSGLGGHFPLGYPVGTVETIEHDPGRRFAGIAVQPSAELNRSRQVLLVWPGDGENIVTATTPATEGAGNV
jgi:rod shape-determining protein MreC